MMCGRYLMLMRLTHRRFPQLVVGLMIIVISLVIVRTFRHQIFSRREPSATGVDGTLVIFHAGSLSQPFHELAALYEKRHPRAKVLLEAAGSRQCARKIRDLGQRADVFGSADYKVVENLLMPEFARFNIHFAVNEMVIAYNDDSLRHQEITVDNWPEVLADPEVRFGRADPNSDPCGYRTEIVFQLAERHFRNHDLANRLREKHGNIYIRPKETDLLALLEAGEIDYLPIYRSVAEQHGLLFVRLPSEVNLSDPKHTSIYQTARVTVTGKTPGSSLELTGEPIVYSLTIPTDAPNPSGAEEFVALALGRKGREIFERNGQAPIVPPRVTGGQAMPNRLVHMLSPAGEK